MAFSSTSCPHCMQTCSLLGPHLERLPFLSMFRHAGLLNMSVDIVVYNRGLNAVMRVVQFPSPNINFIHSGNSTAMLVIGMFNLPPLLTTSLYRTVFITLTMTWILRLTLLNSMAFSHLMTHPWLTLPFLFALAIKVRLNLLNGALLTRLPRPHIVSCNSLCCRHRSVCTLIPGLNCHHT
jgi:hypothetical protein